ncbi:extracellular solute-binding protein [uncultured Sphaerochaeta sp.]|uniref:ABC transporter substrate-binding protein n=1 Tax=uncultured Sphaerochaeta sp. TaxID=886478 RepID=UPI0029CA70BD|nr:extracellular solute-binding protein [uncultured Sphaerochaeta sp.]
MKKALVVLLVLFLALSLFARGTEETGSTKAGSGNPFEDYIELIMYSSGSSGKDTEKVMTKFNEKLKERYNTTINVTCLGWDNYRNQYQLILTTGEPADLMYVNPNLYSLYAADGAFKDVTDLFRKYMPTVHSYFTEGQLAQVKVDGKLFMIPSYESNFAQNGIFYRLDLARKYGLEEITSIESFEKYADVIAANESNLRVIDGNPEQTMFQLFKANYGFESIAGSNTSIIMVKNYDDIHNIIAYPFTDEYVEWAHKMKDWAGNRYWSSNALSSTMDPWSSIQVGTSAITQANADGAKNMMGYMATKLPESECAYWSFANLTGYSYVNPVTENGYAIPTSSPNAERALRILEIIKTDQELFDLWMNGIEGLHFSLTEEGNIIKPAVGVDPSTVNNHSMSGAQYAMRVKNLMRNDAGVWDGYDELVAWLSSIAVLNKFGSVSIDYSDVQAELAAVNQVVQQYGYPINIGIVNNVDAAIDEYRKQLKAAGIDRLLDSVSQQMEAYYARNGIS